jgi:hypothetical protein
MVFVPGDGVKIELNHDDAGQAEQIVKVGDHEVSKITSKRQEKSAPTARNGRASSKSRGESKAPTPAPKPQLTGTVLVMNDLVPPLSDQTAQLVKGMTERLSAQGAKLIGKVPGDRPEAEIKRENDLIVSAIAARGEVPLDSDDAHASMRDWLASNSGSADLVAWIASNPEDRSSAKVYLFYPPKDSPNTKTAGDLSRALKRIVNGGR